MAVTKYSQEFKVCVSTKRMFNALVTDLHIVLPKVLPDAIKSIDLIGDGGPGSIKQTNLVDGVIRHRIDAIDTERLTTKFSLVEGVWLGDKLESINYEAKFEESGDGGCVVKITSEYHSKGDVATKEEDIKAGKDQDIYAAVEKYLLANPNACT